MLDINDLPTGRQVADHTDLMGKDEIKK